MFRNRPVSVVLIGLFVWVTGCTSYKQIEPDQVADYHDIRVTMTDGKRACVYDPVVKADSLRGHESPQGKRYYSDPMLVISLDQVTSFEGAHGTDEAKTGGAVVLGLAIAAGVVFGIAAFSMGQ